MTAAASPVERVVGLMALRFAGPGERDRLARAVAEEARRAAGEDAPADAVERVRGLLAAAVEASSSVASVSAGAAGVAPARLVLALARQLARRRLNVSATIVAGGPPPATV